MEEGLLIYDSPILRLTRTRNASCERDHEGFHQPSRTLELPRLIPRRLDDATTVRTSLGLRNDDSAALFARVCCKAPAATQPQASGTAEDTFTGDVVLWAVTVNPDKTADYEQVLSKVKEALIEDRYARSQAAAGRLESDQELGSPARRIASSTCTSSAPS